MTVAAQITVVIEIEYSNFEDLIESASDPKFLRAGQADGNYWRNSMALLQSVC